MKNREIFLKDPSATKLVNEGVASVNDDRSSQAMAVLRYELDTFVCDGQYEKGIEHILRTYLDNLSQGASQQPGVWVSGFFGSGKSHLIKMLRALWEDTSLTDGTTARAIANLPPNICDLLKELSTQGKRHGGLHAASGTLGAGASGSVRLALLRIIFRSVSLPEQYPLARFVMWLKSEGIYEKVRNLVETNGYDWQEELDNFYVAEGLHEALVTVKPNLFSSSAMCVETLNNLYPYVQDISSDDMIKAIRQALTREGKFPLTLIVMDEVQQYIGDDSQRSMDVQEAVEACCKNIGGKLLFIGTGQTAVTGTSNLKKLEGRFTIRVELSDTDVNTVIRKVILAKKADAILPIEQMMQNNLGEISRHLDTTKIGHRQEDIQYFTQDYPILPVRSRFWESTQRVLDQTGTDSQLRNQLSMIHKAIQFNVDGPLGSVIPADYLYFDSADKMLQARILPRKVHEKTMHWIKGSEDEQIKARACGLVFLINKIDASNDEIGIRATVNTIADLMVNDLSVGSSSLRSKLPKLLDNELLIKVGEEYRIQTEESSAWNDEFLGQRSQLASAGHRIDSERDDRIRSKFGEVVRKLSLTQGKSKISRDLYPIFDPQLPSDCDQKLYLWIRDGWSTDENSVRVDARQAGNHSSTIFIFIPKRSADDLRSQLIEYKAAVNTLNTRGVPNTPEGTEARAAMETTRQTAETRINELLAEALAGSRVFQGGGNEILGNNLQEMVIEAAENALQRLYTQFHIADQDGWDKVYARAKQGSADALKAVGDDGEVSRNPVVKTILAFIAGGKKGTEIRNHFENPHFGWSRDTVDGALYVLMVAGLIRVQDERGQAVDFKDLERRQLGKVSFKVEATTVSTTQRIQVRKLLQKLGIQAQQGQEQLVIPEFLQKLQTLAQRAGGEAPQPQLPDTSIFNEIRLTAGNEQILLLYNQREELGQAIDTWNELAAQIEQRWPTWLYLQKLLGYAGSLKAAQEIQQQVQAIKEQRLLLNDPDPVQPLAKYLEDALRQEMLTGYRRYVKDYTESMAKLNNNANWQQLTEDEHASILEQCNLSKVPELSMGSSEELMKALEKHPLRFWQDRIDALPDRFARIHELAAKALEPEVQSVQIPSLTLKTEEDIEDWLQDVRELLMEALHNGPIIIH